MDPVNQRVAVESGGLKIVALQNSGGKNDLPRGIQQHVFDLDLSKVGEEMACIADIVSQASDVQTQIRQDMCVSLGLNFQSVICCLLQQGFSAMSTEEKASQTISCSLRMSLLSGVSVAQIGRILSRNKNLRLGIVEPTGNVKWVNDYDSS